MYVEVETILHTAIYSYCKQILYASFVSKTAPIYLVKEKTVFFFEDKFHNNFINIKPLWHYMIPQNKSVIICHNSQIGTISVSCLLLTSKQK